MTLKEKCILLLIIVSDYVLKNYGEEIGSDLKMIFKEEILEVQQKLKDTIDAIKPLTFRLVIIYSKR